MKILLFFVLFVGLVIQVFAQTDTISGDYKVKGIVKDQTGAVFAGLNLYVRKGDKDHTFSTDINGEFEIGLQPGEYEITVNKLYSNSFKAFIKIRDGGLNPNDLVFVLDSSQICCNDSGGKPYPKIVSLYKPPFPPVAMAVRATGEIIVAVQINKDGTVISSNAEGGHPLLRKAAELAAEKSQFEGSNEESLRNALLSFVFLISDKQKDNIKHYSNPYRQEIVGQAPILYTAVSY